MDRVTSAWLKIHSDHPEIYSVNQPAKIRRLKHRDFFRVIKKYCLKKSDMKILEAGCGSGRDSLLLSSLGFSCTAVDISDSPLRKLEAAAENFHKKFPEQKFSLELVQSNIFSLPFETATFDLVFNSGVLEHFDSDMRLRLLRELARVTSSSGFVCIVTPNKNHMLNRWWTFLISRFSDFDRYEIPEQKINDEIGKEMKEAGFTLEYTEWLDAYDTLSHFPNWKVLSMISYFLTLVLPRPPLPVRKKFGTRVMFIGRKI
ncbi:MAG: methyltransferase domain-containing protein [Chitinophagales bacterium]